jgi:hypothetical protein
MTYQTKEKGSTKVGIQFVGVVKLAESHMGEWFLQSLDFFNCSVENSKSVKREKLVSTHNNYELILFTSFCPTLVCTTPFLEIAIALLLPSCHPLPISIVLPLLLSPIVITAIAHCHHHHPSLPPLHIAIALPSCHPLGIFCHCSLQ